MTLSSNELTGNLVKCSMKKFGIYTLVCLTDMIICARAAVNSGEGFVQWFLVLMALINLFMLFSLVDIARTFSELDAERDDRRGV